MAVHRRRGLNALTEGDDPLRRAEGDCLNDVVSALAAGRNHRKAKALKQIGRKDRPLQGGRRYGGRKEQSLIKILQNAQRRSHLLSQSRRGEAVRRIFHTFSFPGNVSADGGQPSAGILDQGPHHHVGAYIAGFFGLHEFPIAVVHHADHVRLNPLDEGDKLSDSVHGKGGTGLVAL